MQEEFLEDGITVVTLKNFENHVLPKLDALKQKVEAGGVIDDYEAAFLDRLLTRLNQAKSDVDSQPEWQPLFSRIVSFCHEIVAGGLSNHNPKPD